MIREEFVKPIEVQDASKLKIGIVVAQFNPDITGSLLAGALETLKEWQVDEKNVEIFKVHGSFELTHASNRMVAKHAPDAVIALGCVIKGDTKHDEYIASAVTHGLTNLTIKHGIPISLGLVTTNTLEQAEIRSQGDTNHGTKAAVASLQAALL